VAPKRVGRAQSAHGGALAKCTDLPKTVYLREAGAIDWTGQPRVGSCRESGHARDLVTFPICRCAAVVALASSLAGLGAWAMVSRCRSATRGRSR
jgi:hypothetical protein